MANLEIFKNLTRFRKPLIDEIIKYVGFSRKSAGVDLGCGTGQISQQISDHYGPDTHIIGMDYSQEMIDYATIHSHNANVQYIKGDINKLPFDPDTYDWIWCMDTAWAGPEEYGCPALYPDKMLAGMKKILKPGGTINLSYWTSQKLLPGYPLLEARLDASTTAHAPYTEEMDSYIHVMNAKQWLKTAGFIDIKVKTFTADVTGPLEDHDQKALAVFFQMFWGSRSMMFPKMTGIYLMSCALTVLKNICLPAMIIAVSIHILYSRGLSSNKGQTAVSAPDFQIIPRAVKFKFRLTVCTISRA